MKVAPALLLSVFFLLGAATILQKSPTFDETAHLPAGYYYLQTGRFDLADHNPPLSKLIAAVPLLAARPVLPGRDTDDHWLYGHLFQEANAARYHRIYVHARLAILLLGVALGASVYLWSRSWFGPTAALSALLLFSVSPNMLAHSTLVTSDLALALFAFVTIGLFARGVRSGSAKDLAPAGVGLGLALLSKFSALVLPPILLAVGLLLARPRRLIVPLVILSLVGLLTVNAGYLFRGWMLPFGGVPFQSELFRAMPPHLRLPLPVDWLKGLDIQLVHNRFPPPVYLFGNLHPGGQPWYYELAALLLKTTIPLLVLSSLGAVLLVRSWRREHVALIVPVVAFCLVVPLVVNLKIGMRYLLPVYPFLMVIAGYAASRLFAWGAWGKVMAGALLGWQLVSSGAAFPHYLAYFNESIGSNRNGYRYLVDSNLDWGQDLPALRSFMRERNIEVIRLSYFGTVDPYIYGIRYEPIPAGGPAPGWYAVSATHLAGVYDPRIHILQTMFQGDAELHWFRELEPVAILGNSILVYHVDAGGTG